MMKHDPFVTIVTVTLNRESLRNACESVDKQTYKNYHHYVLGDGVLPIEFESDRRSTLGFTKLMGLSEPGANMPNGTPNPMLRWALKHLDLGKYVCFLDDDNEYHTYFIEKMVNALENNPDKGIALCGANDLRYFQNIDGYPEIGRCDNSAFMLRCEIAKEIEFPYASMDKNVVQDCEYIMICADKYGYIQVPEKLLFFGSGLNPPPQRGKYLFLVSWKLPQDAFYLAFDGEHEKAVGMLQEAIKSNPYDAWSVWTLAEVYSLMNHREEAEKHFNDWIAMFEKADCDDYGALYRYAIALKLFHRPYEAIINKAIVELDNRICTEPNAIEHYYDKVVYHYVQGEYDMMAANLEKALTLNSNKKFWAHRAAIWSFQVFSHLFDNQDIIQGVLTRL